MDAFTRITAAKGYTTDLARARALGMSHTVISRLRSGQNNPGAKFISRTLALGINYDDVFRRAA